MLDKIAFDLKSYKLEYISMLLNFYSSRTWLKFGYIIWTIMCGKCNGVSISKTENEIISLKLYVIILQPVDHSTSLIVFCVVVEGFRSDWFSFGNFFFFFDV